MMTGVIPGPVSRHDKRGVFPFISFLEVRNPFSEVFSMCPIMYYCPELTMCLLLIQFFPWGMGLPELAQTK